jgi:hypothetical protein
MDACEKAVALAPEDWGISRSQTPFGNAFPDTPRRMGVIGVRVTLIDYCYLDPIRLSRSNPFGMNHCEWKYSTHQSDHSPDPLYYKEM